MDDWHRPSFKCTGLDSGSEPFGRDHLTCLVAHDVRGGGDNDNAGNHPRHCLEECVRHLSRVTRQAYETLVVNSTLEGRRITTTASETVSLS